VEADPTTLEVRDNDGCVALHRAVQDEAPMAVIRYLVENGRGALTMADHRGRLPIHVACDRQLPLAQLQSLVEADPTTLEVRDNDGCVALHRAIESTDFGDPLELRTVQMLIDAHPSSLEVSDRFGSTPIMRAILAASEEEEVVPEAFDALYRMIDVGGANSLQARWTRYDGSTDWDSALHLSVRLLPNLGLVSSLLWADRQVLGVRDSDGRLPLHVACAAPAGDEALDVIALLIEASPASAFEARDNFGMTPIMIFNSIESRYFRRNVEVLHFLHLLVEMVRRSPLSVRGTFSFDPPFSFDPDARSNGTTVLEVACTRIPRAEKLVLLVMEAWPAALCVSLAFDLRDLGLPQELETAMTREARLMLLALVEVLLHETTREIAVDAIQGGIHSDAPRGVVLDTIRNHILRAVGQRVDDDVGRLVLGGSIGLVQEIQKNVRGDSFGALRSDVLYHHDLQQLLEEHEPLLEMVTGVYHMNRAGRLGPEGNVVNESEVIPDSTAFSAQQHVRVLESVKDNLSCLFLHVRGCPALFARVRKANPERMHSDEGAGIQQEYDQDLEDRIDISTNERLISMVRQIAAVQAQLAAAQTTLLEAMWQDDPVEKRKLAADGEAQFVDACLAFRAAQHSAAVVELPANAGDASA
jgi:ankyrin repeat protein